MPAPLARSGVFSVPDSLPPSPQLAVQSSRATGSGRQKALGPRWNRVLAASGTANAGKPSARSWAAFRRSFAPPTSRSLRSRDTRCAPRSLRSPRCLRRLAPRPGLALLVRRKTVLLARWLTALPFAPTEMLPLVASRAARSAGVRLPSPRSLCSRGHQGVACADRRFRISLYFKLYYCDFHI